MQAALNRQRTAALARSHGPLTCPSSVSPRSSRLAAVSRDSAPELNRRDALLGAALVAGLLNVSPAQAIDTNPFSYKKTVKNRRRKIPESEYKDGPDGLKYYDLEVGTGAEAAPGERIAIHYDVKFRGITFMSSRVGMGVTGGTPFGFDVGQAPGAAGGTMAGIDLGVRGMRVGGIRKLKVPPNLAYGNKQMGEIPPDSTLDIDVELLSIKTNPLGYRTKLIEG